MIFCVYNHHWKFKQHRYAAGRKKYEPRSHLHFCEYFRLHIKRLNEPAEEALHVRLLFFFFSSSSLLHRGDINSWVKRAPRKVGPTHARHGTSSRPLKRPLARLEGIILCALDRRLIGSRRLLVLLVSPVHASHFLGIITERSCKRRIIRAVSLLGKSISSGTMCLFFCFQPLRIVDDAAPLITARCGNYKINFCRGIHAV